MSKLSLTLELKKILTRRPRRPGTELFDVIGKLDPSMYSRAAEEQQQFGQSVADPIASPTYAHFEGLSQPGFEIN